MGIAGTVCTIVINKNIISPGIAPAVIIVGLDNLSVSSSYHGSTPRSSYIHPFMAWIPIERAINQTDARKGPDRIKTRASAAAVGRRVDHRALTRRIAAGRGTSAAASLLFSSFFRFPLGFFLRFLLSLNSGLDLGFSLRQLRFVDFHLVLRGVHLPLDLSQCRPVFFIEGVKLVLLVLQRDLELRYLLLFGLYLLPVRLGRLYIFFQGINNFLIPGGHVVQERHAGGELGKAL